MSLKEIIDNTFIIIGFGVVLHYGAFLIAWGVAKGWAKVQHVVNHTGTQTINKYNRTIK